VSINPLDLVFRPDDRAPLELVFGDDAAGTAPEYALSGGGQITGLQRASAELVYDVNVARPLLARRSGAWQEGQPASVGLRSAWQDSSQLTRTTRIVSEPGQPMSRAQRSHWQSAQELTSVVRAVEQPGLPVAHVVQSRFEQARALALSARSHFQHGEPVGVAVKSAFQEVIRLAPVIRGRFQPGVHLVTLRHEDMQPGLPLLRTWRPRFQQAQYPLPGGQPPRPEPPGRSDWCYVPTDPIELLFRPDALAPLELVFECDRHGEPEVPQAPLYILPARFYMATHSLTAVRLPELTPLPIWDFTFSADKGSFGWTLSASGPSVLRELLVPVGGAPVLVRFELDGLAWVGSVTDRGGSDGFSDRVFRFGARSVTSLLGATRAVETAYTASADFTAQQLALAALEFSGVGLDWGIDDWLVSAGAWSHYGTPLSAVGTIAAAAGGYLQSHRTDPTLLVRHPYPTLPGGIPGGPWNWYGAFAADVELAPDSIIVTSDEYEEGPDINAVYVMGQNSGYRAHVTRDGTAGDKLAGIVVEPLNTDVLASRQRGLSILGAGGVKRKLSLSMGIHTGPSQPGVLEVGQLVQINWAQPVRGRVRGVSGGAAFGGSPGQTVAIEQHLGAY
jgi:hypothetical protein